MGGTHAVWSSIAECSVNVEHTFSVKFFESTPGQEEGRNTAKQLILMKGETQVIHYTKQFYTRLWQFGRVKSGKGDIW